MEELENQDVQTVEDIDNKLDEISEQVKDAETEEQVEALEEQVSDLEEEKRSLIESAEKRAETLKKVIEKKDEGAVKETAEDKEERNMDNEKTYRSAYFKKLMRKELTEEEQRALSTTTTATIPTETSENIFSKALQIVPLLNEIELFHVRGNLKFAVETVRSEAGYHEENSTNINTDSTAVLTTVSLGGYEFTKLIQVSASMLNQSIDAFENWLVNMLAESIATALENQIINGSGDGQVKGIGSITYTDANSVQYNESTGLTAANVREAVGKLNGFYDNGAKIAMSKRTLFTKFMGLQDKSKTDVVKVEGNTYYVYGYPVILSDQVATGTAYLGNFKKYVGNLSADIEVKSDFDIDTNSYKYLGVCEFDGKPAAEDAFIKIYA